MGTIFFYQTIDRDYLSWICTLAIAAFSSQKVFGDFTILIRNIKHRLIIKLITQMDGKSRDESIKSN